ncbi:hypothetical protein CQZ93_24160 [Ochrobactrum vermis]|nr:hypothetical protein CQZ93_24160 [Ochrobactrum vermis]
MLNEDFSHAKSLDRTSAASKTARNLVALISFLVIISELVAKYRTTKDAGEMYWRAKSVERVARTVDWELQQLS